jgi:hypothetical protein
MEADAAAIARSKSASAERRTEPRTTAAYNQRTDADSALGEAHLKLKDDRLRLEARGFNSKRRSLREATYVLWAPHWPAP